MKSVELKGLGDADFQVREAYKTLRTNLQFCGQDVKVIAITSCTENEGKTSTAINLAHSLAELGKDVLFIDADLRKSVITSRHMVGKNIKGLAHYLTGQCSFDEVVYSTNIEHLYCVFAGVYPPNPAELLSSRYFVHLTSSLKKIYDYVIIDTPPLGRVIDAAIVAMEYDGVAMVIESNWVSHKYAKNVLEQLQKADCRILGVILNKVDMSGGRYGSGYGKYYGKGYGKYYGHAYGASPRQTK